MHFMTRSAVTVNYELKAGLARGRSLKGSLSGVACESLVMIRRACFQAIEGGLLGTQNRHDLIELGWFGARSHLAGLHHPHYRGRPLSDVHDIRAANDFFDCARLCGKPWSIAQRQECDRQ